MTIIKRDYYLQQLIERQNVPLIKVITGIRRCGKSYLLDPLFKNYLQDHGVDAHHIIKIDLEQRRNDYLREPDALNQYVHEQIVDRQKYYIIVDEVQLVPDFVSVLNEWLREPNLDVYVTGSNSQFLSSDIATQFRGRGDNIQVYPLSFAEFMSVYHGPAMAGWLEYLQYGGLPIVVTYQSPTAKRDYLQQQTDNVYLNDIKERHNIRNDYQMRQLIQTLASGVGSLTNPQKIANTFLSQNLEIDHKTVGRYLEYLTQAFLIEPCQRYDIRGRYYINSPLKYYFMDLGLRNSFLGFRQIENNYLMENAIYLELRRRGFHVDVGVVQIRIKDENDSISRIQTEVDFIATAGNEKYYLQSAYTIPDEQKRQQELRSLRQVDDSFKKMLIVGDPTFITRDADGIITMNVIDFLLDEHSLQA